MKKLLKLLGILFVIQLALAVWLWLPDAPAGFAQSNAPLLSFTPADIDEIRLASSKTDTEDAQTVVVRRQEGRWTVPDYFSMPAGQKKVEDFLASLLSLKAGWPVATTAQSARRFEVGEDNYQRRIELLDEGKVIATLYLGTSPGLRKVHARVPASENTYSVDFAVFNAPVKGKEWSDPAFLHLDQARITTVRHSQWTLAKAEDTWRLEGLDSGQNSNVDAIKGFVGQLAALGYDEVLGTEEKPEFKLAESAVQIETVLDDGRTLVYRFAQPEDNYAVLKRSDDDRIFRIANFQIGTLLTTNREQFVGAVASPAAASQDTQDGLMQGMLEGGEDGAFVDEPVTDDMDGTEPPMME